MCKIEPVLVLTFLECFEIMEDPYHHIIETNHESEAFLVSLKKFEVAIR